MRESHDSLYQNGKVSKIGDAVLLGIRKAVRLPSRKLGELEFCLGV